MDAMEGLDIAHPKGAPGSRRGILFALSRPERDFVAARIGLDAR